MGDLSDDQRWLLAGVGGWMMADCLVAPQRGVRQLMASMCGSSTGRRDDRYPEWLAQGYSCGYGRIVAPMTWSANSHTPPLAVVTSRELARFAASVDADAIERLDTVRRALTIETVRWSTSCHCPRGMKWHEQESSPLYRERWHPTAEEDREHSELTRRLSLRLQDLILQACAVVPPEPGQLDLFDPDTVAVQ